MTPDDAHVRAAEVGRRRSAEDTLARVLERTGVGLWRRALPAGELEWDARTRELHFVPEDVQLTFDLFWSRLHPDDREPTRLAIAAAMRDHALYSATHRVVNPGTGEVRWVRAVGEATYAADGTPTGFDGINYDVTDLKRAEDELRASERVYRAVGETIDYGVWVCAPDGRNTYASESFLKLVGLTQEQCSNFGWGDVLHPDDAERTIAAWKSCTATGGVWDIEHRFRGVDGQWHPILARGVPVRDEHGEIICWAGINLDISHLKHTEDELRAAKQRLESLLDALRDADRRKDEFIAVLSHELRNPLAPIRYALPLLEREPLGDAGKRAVAVIGRQVHHLTRLVDDLLDVSRITRGKIELQRTRLTLGSVVTAAIEAAAPTVSNAGLDLRLALADEPVWLDADAARLTQVVTNLLNNAAKYTPRGGQVTVEAGAEAGQAVVRVRDNGVGIPPEALPTLFEMFCQVRAPGQSQDGLGVGLGLVRWLVEMHGGTVEARSEGRGRGSEFVVRLPLAFDGPPAGAADPHRVSTPPRALTVLVVDDNVDFVETLTAVVSALGHEVHSAFDGPGAVSEAVACRPDVVLLDLGLPGMSGLDVARELRARPETARARLVALTGWGQDVDRQRSALAGFDHHLTKPTDPDTLERILQAAAESR